jgi:pimeloyl-ACP methyl ester carboxylesterase
MNARRRRLAFSCVALGALCSAAHAQTQAPERTMQLDFVRAPDGLPLCTAEIGPTDAPAIVLVHGFTQSYAVFKRQFESDLARRFRLVAFDLRGHGCSGKPWTEEAYKDTRIWANDVRAVLEAKKVEKPLLVGWSFGGFVLMDYVRHHGTNGLRGLVLVGSHGGLAPPPTDPAVLARLEKQREANRNASPDVEAKIAGGDQFMKLMSAKPLPEDIARIMFVANQLLPAYAQRAMSTRSLANEDVIPKLDVPVTFLIGGKDFAATPEVLGALAKRIPGSRVMVYADSGHSPFAEEPERFNADVAALAGEKN